MPEALRGTLDWVSASGILQLAETESLTGTLQLPGGAISVFAGQVTAANYRGLSGTSAVIEALSMARGAFHFITDTTVPNTPIGQTTGLIMASCQVLDDFERVGSLKLRRAQDVVPRIADLDLRLFSRALDGVHTAAHHMARLQMRLVPTLSWLQQQIDAGHLTSQGSSAESAIEVLRGATPPPVQQAPPNRPSATPMVAPMATESFDDLMFSARLMAKKKQYVDAERALVSALRLAPGHRIAIQNLNRIRSLQALQS